MTAQEQARVVAKLLRAKAFQFMAQGQRVPNFIKDAEQIIISLLTSLESVTAERDKLEKWNVEADQECIELQRDAECMAESMLEGRHAAYFECPKTTGYIKCTCHACEVARKYRRAEG